MIHSENIKMIEDELVPFGFIDSYDQEIETDDIVWDGTIGTQTPWSKY